MSTYHEFVVRVESSKHRVQVILSKIRVSHNFLSTHYEPFNFTRVVTQSLRAGTGETLMVSAENQPDMLNFLQKIVTTSHCSFRLESYKNTTGANHFSRHNPTKIDANHKTEWRLSWLNCADILCNTFYNFLAVILLLRLQLRQHICTPRYSFLLPKRRAAGTFNSMLENIVDVVQYIYYENVICILYC